MGCDAFANKDGVFEIVISDYETGSLSRPQFMPRRIRIEGLRSEHRIDIEIVEGEER